MVQRLAIIADVIRIAIHKGQTEDFIDLLIDPSMIFLSPMNL